MGVHFTQHIIKQSYHWFYRQTHLHEHSGLLALQKYQMSTPLQSIRSVQNSYSAKIVKTCPNRPILFVAWFFYQFLSNYQFLSILHELCCIKCRIKCLSYIKKKKKLCKIFFPLKISFDMLIMIFWKILLQQGEGWQAVIDPKCDRWRVTNTVWRSWIEHVFSTRKAFNISFR